MTKTHADGALGLQLYRAMAKVNRCDARLRSGLSSGEFAFTYWPVEGQEAMSAGAACALRPEDRLVATYRGLGDLVARGIPLPEYFAELLGKAHGLSKGKAGAMGCVDPSVGVFMTTGIVGAGPPIANGIALASVIQNDNRVTLVSFGDGSTSIGFVHEAMNLAALWALPVVFFCQNNGWAECTPVIGYTKTAHLADRAAGYGMQGVTVDGTDPLAVHTAVSAACDAARRGDGPTFVEAVAYRLQGHYFGDAMPYVDQGELAAARTRDPVGTFRRRLVDTGLAQSADLDGIDAELDAEIALAVEFAKSSPASPPEELYTDVYRDRSDDGSVAVPEARRAETPSGPSETMGLVQAINHTLDRALARDSSVILLGEDIADPAGGIFRVTAGLSTKYGVERVRATPIAETSIIGAAIGASLAGLRPVAEVMFMDFIGVCLDQIANHAAKVRYLSGGRQSAPLTIRTAVGAGSGPQHSQSLEAWLMHMPGLKVAWPSNSADAAGLLTACIEDDDPCIFVESMSLFFAGGRGPVPVEDHRVPLGAADIKRPGRDISVVTYGPTVGDAMQAAEELAAEGIDVEVVDLRTLVPLDLHTILESVGRTRRLVVAHESPTFCGPGAEIAATVGHELFGDLLAPVLRVAASHTPVPRSAELEALSRPSVSRLKEAVGQACR
jgi:2-oxoisovalerate dehydrogenase E1 component